MVQFCLASTSEIGTMKAILQSVASANKLQFNDNSAETESDLNSMAEDAKNLAIARPTVNAGTIGPGRMGFTAMNFPEAPSQIVVGFSKDHDPAAARRLSDLVVQALSKRWHIHEVPTGGPTGAFPLRDCNS